MIKNLIAILILAVFISSCGETGSKEKYVKGFKTIAHKSSNGQKPQIGEYVFFNLDIYTDDGTVINESPRGDEMPALQIIAEEDIPDKSNPVIAILGDMSVGDSLSLYIPIDSMPNPPASMIGAKHIEYVIETVDIMNEEQFAEASKKKQEEATARLQIAMAEAPKILADIETTLQDYLDGKNVGEVREGPNGLKIIIVEPGEGPTANAGQFVDVAYAGYLEDLSSFDNSYNRGSPYKLNLGQGSVIKGWDEGLVYLNKGAKAILDIPSELGYGAGGSPPRIPGGARLLFFVEMEDIN